MSALPDTRAVSLSTAGYEDGLGRRSVRFDREVGGMLECLHLRPELWGFEEDLRGRAEAIASLEDERFVRVRTIERGPDGLTVVSELLAGGRLADIVDSRVRDDSAAFGIDSAIGFLLQALPALAALHTLSMAHGAVAPGRILVTPASQIVLLDGIYAAALERLNLSRQAMWTNLGLLASPFAGAPRFDRHADIVQAACCALVLAIGRPLEGLAAASALAPLVREVRELAEIRAGGAFAEGVHRFFSTALPVGSRPPRLTADEAAADVERLAEMLGEEGCHAAFAHLTRLEPAPARLPVPDRENEEEEEDVQVALQEDPLEEEAPAEPALADAIHAGSAVEPMFAPRPQPTAVRVPVAAETPQLEADTPLQPAAPQQPPARPARVVEPILPLRPAATILPVAPAPAVSAPQPETPTGIVPLPQAVDFPRPAPIMPPAAPPTQALPVVPPISMVPTVAAAPPIPVAPPAAVAPTFVVSPAIAPLPAPVAGTAPPIGIAPVQPAPVRIRNEPPAGFTPSRSTREPSVPSLPFVNRPMNDDPRRVPWKLVAAAVIVLTVGVFAGHSYLQGPAEKAPPPTEPARPVASAGLAPPAGMTMGGLAIDTQPTGAKVSIDGADAGVTPLRLESLSPGRHTIVVTTDTATVRRTVRVEAGKIVTLDIPVYSGWVVVFSPIPLDIASAGATLGNTDTGRIVLPPGRHVLTLSNREYGFSDTRAVEILPGEERPLNIEPKGLVNVNAHPWAEVWIDGKKAGDTPLANLPVLLGTRVFVFKHPQYGERRLTTTITSKPTALTIDLTKP